MTKQKTYDFGGYATKNDIQCSDGRTIRQDAFKHDHGRVVPLVWQHNTSDPANILGHAELENRPDGVYAKCYFNDSPNAANAKNLVKHGAINALSIYANKLGQVGRDVMSGVIREVSLVLSGANPGALIDTLGFSHSDDWENEPTEAIIYTGENLSLSHSDTSGEEESDSDDKTETVGEILETLTSKQKAAVGLLIEELELADDEDDEDDETSEGETKHMKTNVFDSTTTEDNQTGQYLSHSDFIGILEDARKMGSFKEAMLAHAGTYGLDNIGVLFPDAKNVSSTPDFVTREMGWVSGVLSGTRHTPFSRIKSMSADITADEARAKGYVTGAEKKEEVFALLSRKTGPTTIYKKQKLDRDDILDITDIDVVAWLRAEMRVMLDEEIARAVLVGDGREVDSPDKIDEECIRPIYKDAEFYSHRVTLTETDAAKIVDELVRASKFYKGTGSPTFFTTPDVVTDLLLVKDTLGRRLYPTLAELSAAIRVSKIVEVPVMENMVNADGDKELYGIIVNLSDYTIGADKGGDVNAFDDFDIDFNQYKYLIETRCSGALTKPKSAIVIEKPVVVEPVAPPEEG